MGEYGYIIVGVIALGIIFLIWWIGTSNSFRRRLIKIDEAKSGIEVALTKRYDMLTKLLDTAKGYAAHEKDVIYETINLRRGMTIAEMQEASSKIDKLAQKLNVVAEAYPQLRSSDVFVNLQHGVIDAEEHLQAARRLYNSSVSSFNMAIAVFPSNIVARSQNLAPKEFFEADERAKSNVQIRF